MAEHGYDFQLCSRDEPILGSATRFSRVSDTRYSVVTSLPKPSIKKNLNSNSFTGAHIYMYESKLTYIDAQGPIYL